MKNGSRRRHLVRLSSVFLISAFILAVAVLAVPFYSASATFSPNGALQPRATLGRSGWIPTLSLPSMTGETIAVYAADCTTPKISFNLGETVCAKTDGVDLTIPGNYYVNWTGPNGTTNDGTITPVTRSARGSRESLYPTRIQAYQFSAVSTGSIHPPS